MQLSQTAEYALRAAVWLGQHAGDPQTTQQIAEGCQMPASYLAKVLQPLTRAGILSAQRGLGGGYVLVRNIDELSLLDVINAVEPVQRIHTCPLKISTHGKTLCPLHRALDNTMAAVERALAEQTVGNLLKQSATVKPLCRKMDATSVKPAKFTVKTRLY
ncbi:MAG: Rrf2 family transcriptional regulator [Tepidisphaeraceae bacterium]